MNPQEWDDLEQEITGCRWGDPDNCNPYNHPECHQQIILSYDEEEPD